MGTRQNRLGEADLTSTHNLCFEQKCEKYQYFSSDNFHFLVVRFSVYLNRHVFVMFCEHSDGLASSAMIYETRQIRAQSYI